MAKSRYPAQGVEAEFEPGSRGRVLRNQLGIKTKREMDWVEHREQLRALEELVGVFGPRHCFRAVDVCEMHRRWLGGVYGWAGRYRQVNLSKGGFLFAAASRVPQLMAEFERGVLAENTPCRFETPSGLVRALAVVHAEFILIHPFREGNGRLARMLATLMALQAGAPPLDFGGIRGKRRQEYFAAVQAGLARVYEPMERIFSLVLRRSRRAAGAV